MLALDKILLPVDFSGRSCGAARYLEALTTSFSPEVILLHVIPPPHYEFSALEVGGAVLNDLLASRTEQVRKQLETFLSDEMAAIGPKRVLLEGDPARKIVEYAETNGVRLIMMPTHGYGGFRRFILGSVTAKVLHDSVIPVMTGVHLEQAPKVGEIHFRHIIAGVDLGPQSEHALRWAAEFAASFGAKVTMVHAVPCIQAPADEFFHADFAAQMNAEARDRAEQLRTEAGIHADIVISNGDAASVLTAAALQQKSDLMVIARGSAAGIPGRLRTNAYAIIRQSPCPVVSV